MRHESHSKVVAGYEVPSTAPASPPLILPTGRMASIQVRICQMKGIAFPVQTGDIARSIQIKY